MLPIQRREDQRIAHPIGFFGQIGFAARLTALLRREPFRANTLVDKYRHELAHSYRSFMFKEIVVEKFDVLLCDLEVSPVVSGNKRVAYHYSALKVVLPRF